MQNLFYVLTLSVFALMHCGIYFWFFKRLNRSYWFLNTIKILLGINFAGILMYFLGRYFISIPKEVYFLSSLSIGLCFMLFVVSIFYQMILWLCLAIDQSRREALQKGIGLFSAFLGAGYVGWGILEGELKPKVERVHLTLMGLKKPFLAVQVSDLHISGLIGADEVRGIVRKINSLNPDVIFLTGDILDTKVNEAEEALKELERLDSPVYFVLGNHEYFHRVREVVEKMKALGFFVLQNQSVVFEKSGVGTVNIVGVNDLFGERMGMYEPDLTEALKGRDETLPSILLAHQPKFIHQIKEEDKIDLVLSGHTHGGQIFPFGLLVRLEQPYVAGLYQHTPTTKIYVNRGTGFWGPPIRVGARAEITLFEFDSPHV